DAAHAFGVKIDGRSILDYGDLSVLSFHATKLFNSIEGGATFCHTQKIRDRIQSLKNFGIIDEDTVISPGINGKMNEFQAAFGLLGLKQVDQEISDRKKLTEIYRLALKDVPGISMQQDIDGVTHNYSYFPILVESDSYGCTRDELYTAFRECNVYTRKYFYPLCSDFKCYSALPSAKPENLPVAQRVSKQVLCLPLYGDMEEEIVLNICSIVQQIHLLCKQG
ncbi:MAG: DegT/DnrJ/EryC1/StrS family aminotransferase, partial [Candidatus Heimdallarchaeota archaeon]|nr:DegT/DnrJ/EryC1/StrS family aminotransferase [Candidatus Heimdallarchaeota archaeon]